VTSGSSSSRKPSSMPKGGVLEQREPYKLLGRDLPKPWVHRRNQAFEYSRFTGLPFSEEESDVALGQPQNAIRLPIRYINPPA
jgi:hypothetical protein